MGLSRPRGVVSLVLQEGLAVGGADLVDEDEHGHRVPAAAAVVGQEARPVQSWRCDETLFTARCSRAGSPTRARAGRSSGRPRLKKKQTALATECFFLCSGRARLKKNHAPQLVHLLMLERAAAPMVCIVPVKGSLPAV